MISLDKSRDFAEVVGQPGIAFQQDGKNFNGRGELVTDFASLKHYEEVDKSPTPDDGSVPKCYVAEDDVKQEKAPDDLESMHWKKLKVLLDIYSEPYVNREQAVAFLKGKN